MSAPATPAHLIPVVLPAFHRKELASGLRLLCHDSERYWLAMSDEEFVAPIGTAWSPADHVRHLTTCVREVARGMRWPRLLLRILFPGGRGVSVGYEEIARKYRKRLEKGGEAGRFAPTPEPVPGDPAAYRTRILDEHHDAVHDLAGLAMQWNPVQVDTVQLPHPLLGRLTVREMLMFTLYHNLHHVLVVAAKRGEVIEAPIHG